MKQNKNLEILKSIKDKKLNKEEKAKIWNIAIGLQAVDKLKPSKYLKYLIQEYLEEKISLNSIEEIIEKNYILNEISEEEFECDLVSTRIVSLILNNEFKLSTQFYTEMHKYLFNKIYVFAGKLRKVNISNPEEILNNDTVEYQPFDLIEKTLIYDFEQEKKFSYKNLSLEKSIQHLCQFTSNIWQVHPFYKGNTKVTAVFIIKYLKSFNFNINDNVFANHSVYFKNALIRANYKKIEDNIFEDISFLEQFFYNILTNTNYELKNKYTWVNYKIKDK